MKENNEQENNIINETNKEKYSPPTLNNNLQSHLILIKNVKENIDMINGTYSNDVVLIENCEAFDVKVSENKRLRGIILCNSNKLHFTVLDSVVVMTRSIRAINLVDSVITISDADIRRIELWGCKQVVINILLSQIQAENVFILIHHDCENISLKYGEMKVDLKQYYPYIEFLNKVDVPNFSEENKIILARCTKVPLFDIFLYDKTDEIFVEKFNFLKYMTKTIEFNNENTNKLLHELVQKNEIIKYIEELKSTPYTLTKEDIKKQYNLEKKEYNEPESTLTPKIKKIAELLKKSKYCIVFTGAGISTSADIPDFRGPKGVWTKEEKKEKIEYGTEIVQTRPTFCHYALTELARQNYIKFLITTNMDGLHWRSGFPLHMYEELHGSAYTEHCIHCHKHYQRNTEVLRGSPDHLTDNFCDFCHKKLMDTIVNFNDTYRNPMEETVVEFQSYNADLVIILGTSCFVQPAASFPEKVVLSEIANAKKKMGKKGDLVLVNLQATPLDEYCSFRCFCETDTFAELLMKELGIENFERKFDALIINKKDDNNGNNDKKCIVF